MTSGRDLVPVKQEIQDEETNSSVHAIPLPYAKIKSEFVEVKQEPLSQNELPSKIKCEIRDDFYNNYDTLAFRNPDVSVKLEEPTHTQLPIAPEEVPTKNSKNEPLTKYTCSCNKVFYDKFQHFRHMLDHTIENMTSVKCYTCDRHFKTKNGMIAHTYSKHIGHRCKICTWRFPTNNMLLEHMELYHNYYEKRGHAPYSKKTNSYLRQKWEKKKRQNDSRMSSSTLNGTKPFSHIKTEPTYNNMEFGRITNIKTEPTFSNNTKPIHPNVKVEPVEYPNIKVEPNHYFSNDNTELTLYSNVKIEPGYYSNVSVEPTQNSNVKIEPSSYYYNINVEPTNYSNVKVESSYYYNMNVEPTNYSNVKFEPSYYYNMNVEPTNHSNVKVEPYY